MNCKNCQTKLQGEKNFCSNCGAKVINHRLNFKTLTQEFFSTFISWENTFLKTFKQLIKNPQDVANNYLDGIRKRYMKPFSYIIIALTIYGIYMLFIEDQMKVLIENLSVKYTDPKQSAFMDNFNKKWMSFTTKYFNIFTLISLPFLALINKILFKQKKFIEHNVILLYSYGTYLYIVSFLGFLALILNIKYHYFYSIVMIIMVAYHIYFYKKMFSLTFLEVILKTILFWLILAGMFLITTILGTILFLLLLKFKFIFM